MIDSIQVYTQNHISVSCSDKTVHIDPFMTDMAPHNAEIILITHDHYDHFSVKDIANAAKKDTVLVVPENMKKKAEEAKEFVGKTVTVKPNESSVIDDLEFDTIPSYNIGKPFHPKSAGWVGYILKIGGKKIYVAGDTDKTPESEAVECDIALVPIGGTYTMNAKEAANLVNVIKPEIAVPVHYGSIVGKEKDGKEFERLVDPEIKVIFKIAF